MKGGLKQYSKLSIGTIKTSRLNSRGQKPSENMIGVTSIKILEEREKKLKLKVGHLGKLEGAK